MATNRMMSIRIADTDKALLLKLCEHTSKQLNVRMTQGGMIGKLIRDAAQAAGLDESADD